MSNDRLYRESITMLLAAPEAFANPAIATAAEINSALARGLAWNITCALDEDGTEFTLGDPDTDDALSFCDEAGNQTATFKNPSVVYQIFRDEDRVANGLYNLALSLLAFPDVPYYAILRVGQDSDVTFTAGNRVSIVGVKTDLPVSVEEPGTNARLSNTFLTDGFVNWGWTLPA